MSIRNLSSGVYGNEVIESKTMQKDTEKNPIKPQVSKMTTTL